ncbi:MAG: A/G-specific adenine glycosylase [Sinobacterium sp.]|nr:A/G-specific adenine glycosylase [Sinobacterium sp.]
MTQTPLAPFSERALLWFDDYGRKGLPWQQNITPYRVWLSEIMLQQTQVITVIDYFQRFTQTFPTVESLAGAPLDEVLHLWSGLGYYTRAKNLHKAANQVMDDFDGQFPSELEQLETLSGVGRSTAAAIRSIAFEQAAAILDGNVKRVLARHRGIEGWPGRSATLKQLWAAADDFTPNDRSRDYTQVMMDLGATVCTRTQPKCAICPVQHDCIALEYDRIDQLPGKKPKKIQPIKTTQMLVIQTPDNGIYLYKRPLTGIWPGLYSLPEIDQEDSVAGFMRKQFSLDSKDYTVQTQAIKDFRHTFSHYHLDISVSQVRLLTHAVRNVSEITSLWYKEHDKPNIGLAAPIVKIVSSLNAKPLATKA